MEQRILFNSIKEHLAKKGLKNKHLVTLLKVSDQTVSKWVTNLKQPTILELYKISFVLEVPVGDLLNIIPAEIIENEIAIYAKPRRPGRSKKIKKK